MYRNVEDSVSPSALWLAKVSVARKLGQSTEGWQNTCPAVESVRTRTRTDRVSDHCGRTVDGWRMTWYEVLESAPAAGSLEQPMAAHLVRWWRTKFRNGYKQFSGNIINKLPTTYISHHSSLAGQETSLSQSQTCPDQLLLFPEKHKTREPIWVACQFLEGTKVI